MAQTHYAFANVTRDPATAALLSLCPGLGQLYNGESRKGFLFLDVAFINLVLMGMIVLSGSLVSAMQQFGAQFGMKVNQGVLEALRQMQFGSPLSIIISGMIIAFVAYAVRDAYDHAMIKRRRALYSDSVIELNEASSGSYIIHFSLILALAIMALFFFIPKPLTKQLIEIEVLNTLTQNTVVKPKTRTISENNNQAKIKKFDPNKAIQKTPPKAELAKNENSAKNANSSARSAAASSSSSSSSSSNIQAKPQPPLPIQASSAHPQAMVPTAKPVLLAQAGAPQMHPAVKPLMPAMLKPALAAATTGNLQSMQPRALPLHNSLPVAQMPKAITSTRSGSEALPVPLPSMLTSGLPSRTGANLMPAAPSASSTLSKAIDLPGASKIGDFAGSGKVFSPHAATGTGSPQGSHATGVPGPLAIDTHIGGPAGGPVPQSMGKGPGSSTSSNSTGDSDIPSPVKAKGKRGFDGDSIRIVPNTGGKTGSPVSGTGNQPMNFSGPKGESTPDTARDVDFSVYMAELQRKIKRCWYPPHGPQSRKVKVMFKIHSGGQLSNLRISQSAGVAADDQAALKAVDAAAPFKNLPAGAPENVDIEFTFDYNVFNSRNF